VPLAGIAAVSMDLEAKTFETGWECSNSSQKTSGEIAPNSLFSGIQNDDATKKALVLFAVTFEIENTAFASTSTFAEHP
jgi:hypothetical protein